MIEEFTTSKEHLEVVIRLGSFVFANGEWRFSKFLDDNFKIEVKIISITPSIKYAVEHLSETELKLIDNLVPEN
jgi:di/tricarboxylate transporter